jgi:hypothetical protein
MRIIAPGMVIDPDRLASVVDDMKNLGSPTIRAVMIDGKPLAIEGSHRLAAAQTLVLPVKLVIVPGWECLQDDSMGRYLFGIAGMIKTGLDGNLTSFDVDVIDEGVPV